MQNTRFPNKYLLTLSFYIRFASSSFEHFTESKELFRNVFVIGKKSCCCNTENDSQDWFSTLATTLAVEKFTYFIRAIKQSLFQRFWGSPLSYLERIYLTCR